MGFIRVLMADYVGSPEAAFEAGKFSNLETMLVAAGVEAAKAERALQQIAELSTDPKLQEEFLPSRTLNRFKESGSQIPICVLHQDCANRPAGGTLIQTRSKGFGVAPLRARFEKERLSPMEIPPDIDDVLVLRGSWDSNREMNFVPGFFHEMTHLEDGYLLSQWVEANKLLLVRGMEADPIFLLVSAVDSQGFVTLDSAFLFYFQESRAYAVEVEVWKRSAELYGVPPNIKNKDVDWFSYAMSQFRMDHAYKLIFESATVDAHWIRTHSELYSPGLDLFRNAERLTRNMESTIQRAKTLMGLGE